MSGSGFPRIKRVTDPLNHEVKARIVPHDVSSGSDHSAHHDDHCAVSPRLSDLVYGFLSDDAGTEPPGHDSDSERDPSVYDSLEGVGDLIKRVVSVSDADSFRNVLYANVNKAVEVFSSFKKATSAQVRRNVMVFLRNLGYNAAICMTKWEGSGGLTAGNYEFIDVLRSDPLNRLTRYFVNLDFAEEFEIARPTSKYEHAVQSVPRIFVGKSEELKQILKVISDAAKRSLKSRDLHLPPWRKHRYMQNKWFGPHKRTTNVFPVTGSVLPQPLPLKQNFAVKCRSVGFDVNSANGRLLLLPATTRTR